MKFLGSSAVTKRVKSKVILKVSRKGKAKGKLRSSQAGCKKARPIVVKKVKRGRDVKAGKAKSNRKGGYKISKRVKKGRYYAKVKSKKLMKKGNIINCTKARSKKVKKAKRGHPRR